MARRLERWREIKPMEIRYSKRDEVPFLVRRQRAAIDHASDLIPTTKLLLHKDMAKYVFRNVLRELYARVKGIVDDDGKVRCKLDPFDTAGVLRTLHSLGSLYLYRVGTCVYDDKDDSRHRFKAVLDLGVVKTLVSGIEEWYTPDEAYTEKSLLRTTGYTMLSVPRAAFELRAFEDIGSGMIDLNRKKLEAGLAERGMSRVEAVKAAEAAKFRVAVEVDRSEMNRGSVLFFMDEESARKRGVVLDELARTMGFDARLWTLVSLFNDEHIYCYKLEANKTGCDPFFQAPLPSASPPEPLAGNLRPEIPAMEILYDKDKEVPVLSVAAQKMDHISSLYIPNPRLLLYNDLNRYMVKNILRELYTHTRNKVFRRSSKFDLGDYDYVVKTLELFGSLYTYQLGTCVKRDEQGKAAAVVLDKGVWRTIEANVVDCFSEVDDQFSMKWVKPTGYVMWSVPRLVVENDAFRVRHGVMDLCHPKLRRELLVQGMSLSKANALVDSMGFKAAVEVERTAVGQGNVVFFMDAKAGKDTGQVLEKLGEKTGLDIREFIVVPHPDHDNEEHVFSYRLESTKSSGFLQ